MANENIYPKGITFFNKRENAPDFVKGSIVISPTELINWMKENKHLLKNSEKYGQQFVFTATDNGLKVDTWKPNQTSQPKKESDLPF